MLNMGSGGTVSTVVPEMNTGALKGQKPETQLAFQQLSLGTPTLPEPKEQQTQSANLLSFFKAAKDFIMAPPMSLAEISGMAPTTYAKPRSIKPTLFGEGGDDWDGGVETPLEERSTNDFKYFNPNGFDFSLRAEPQYNPLMT